jgi:Calcineurin-like phosphoesterase
MARGINWLRITDWHVGQSHQWLWPRMREQFHQDLALLSESAGPWDIVFFSGDFTQKGTVEEFEQVGTELSKLWEHLERLGSHPILIAVPGNHDLQRPTDTSAVVHHSRHWYEPNEEDIRSEFWDNPNCDCRQAITQAFTNYSTWMRPEVLPVSRADVVGGLLPGDFSTVINRNGFRLGIVGLNTTFLQLTSDDHEGRLDIHTKQLIEACGELR